MAQQVSNGPLFPTARLSSPPPRRWALFVIYARRQGPLGTTLAILWSLSAVALAGLLVLFDVAQVRYGRSGAESIALTVFVLALLWLLSVVEGAELAVARLLGTDPKRLPKPSAQVTLGRVQRDPKTFFNGRQALVVTSIVAMTLTIAQIANLPARPVGPGHELVSFLRTWPVHAALVFGFTNFIVLWISQLYPKLRAASDPPGRFTLASYQLVVRVCMWLERTTRLGAPTSMLGILRDRVLLTGVAVDAVAMEPIEGGSEREPSPPAARAVVDGSGSAH